jgi:multiple sugar transport system substrate-binding protein
MTIKRINRRQFLQSAALTGSAALLVSCAPAAPATEPAAEPTKAAEAEPTKEEPVATTAPAGDGITISWWNQFSTPTCQEWFPKIIAMFEEENPGVKVDFEITGGPPGGGDFAELLLARIAAGNPPDTCTLWDPPSGYGARGAMAAIDDLMSNAKTAKASAFYEGVLGSCQFGGKTYGLPASAGAGCMFLNKTMFDAEGVSATREDFPKTWNDYLELSSKFVKWDGDILTRAGGMPWTSGWLYSTWAQLNGGQIYDAKAQQYKIDSPENAEWLQSWEDWLDKQYQGDLEKVAASGTWDDIYGESQFALGNMAVTNSGAWACTDAVFKFEWEVVPFPLGPSGKTAMTSYWPNWFAMPMGGPHPAESFLFIEHMTTDGWALWYTEAIMDTPAWVDYPKDSVNKALVTLVGDERARNIQTFFADQLQSVSDMWSSPVESFANDNLAQAVDSVLRHTASPEEALAQAQKVVQAKLDETLKNL